MTDLFMRPTWDIVNVAAAASEAEQPRESRRAEYCTKHCNGQYLKHLCPDCPHDPSERKYDANRSERKRRQRIVREAALAIVAERTPSSYDELAFLIGQRTGLRIRACHAGEVLKWMRRRGETTVVIMNEQTRKLVQNREKRLAAAGANP